MKDHIYLVSPKFIEEKVRKIITLPGEIGFTARLGLFSGLREQELIYIKEKAARCYLTVTYAIDSAARDLNQ